MKFSIEDEIHHPFESVYPTYRDKLVSLVPYLPDVKSIEILEKERKGKRLRLVNRWTARTQVPGVVRKIIGLDQVMWLDHADWDDDAHRVAWRFEIPGLDDYVQASGKNEFFDEKGKTKVCLSGEFTIDATKHPRVPRLLARTIQPQVEKFIFVLIKPNLLAVNRGLEKLLSEPGKGSAKKK
ncbi:MAG: hypothetical protein HYT87_01215 [Nitrospirae bacterium]|nr:hypothetical protein [Nitrospirota bacterium]